jgi:hypothetical protein
MSENKVNTPGGINPSVSTFCSDQETIADQPAGDIRTRYIHSDIYDRLVDDDDDLVGLVAYGLYQAQKRRWIQNFLEKHGRMPSEPEVQGYCFIYDDEALHKLIAESDELIFKVTEERINERIGEVATKAFNERAIKEIIGLSTNYTAETAKITHALGKLSGYKHHIIGHVLGFLVLAGASAIVLLIVKFGEPSLYFVLSKLRLVSGD